MTMPWNEVAYKFFQGGLNWITGGTSAQQVQGAAAQASTTTINPVLVAGRYNATLPTLTDGQLGRLQLDANGNLRARMAGNAGTGADAQSNTLVYVTQAGAVTASLNLLAQAGFVFNGTTWDRAKKPNTAARLPSSAASTNATVVKASAGDVFAINGYNASAGVIYLKLYNKATAPTIGTDTPAYTLALPPTATFSFNLQSQYFSTGIGYGLTTGAADADTGAIGAGDILGLNIAYQ